MIHFDPTTKNVGYDQAILRYADVLLMYAEALNEIRFDASSSSKALEYSQYGARQKRGNNVPVD